MASVPISKDLSEIKPKIIFNLTLRQLICFSLALFVSLFVYFNLKSILPSNLTTLMTLLSGLPFFFLGIFNKNGYTAEVYALYMIRFYFIQRKVRKKKNDMKR